MLRVFAAPIDPGPCSTGATRDGPPEDVKTLEANDPAIKAGLGFRYEVLPMLQAVVRPR